MHPEKKLPERKARGGDSEGRGFDPGLALSVNNLGQVVRTCVPLSPSRIIWYRSRGGDALQLGR